MGLMTLAQGQAGPSDYSEAGESYQGGDPSDDGVADENEAGDENGSAFDDDQEEGPNLFEAFGHAEGGRLKGYDYGEGYDSEGAPPLNQVSAQLNDQTHTQRNESHSLTNARMDMQQENNVRSDSPAHTREKKWVHRPEMKGPYLQKIIEERKKKGLPTYQVDLEKLLGAPESTVRRALERAGIKLNKGKRGPKSNP